MKVSPKTIFATILVILCCIVKLFSSDSSRVEKFYSTGFYIYTSKVLRALFGWIPFSIGDIIYLFFLLWMIFCLYKLLILLKRNKKIYLQRTFYWYGLRKIIITCSIIYLIFNIFWGINYNRQGITAQLDLKIEKYSREELKNINCILLDKVNQNKAKLVEEEGKYPNNAELFIEVKKAYSNLHNQYAFLDYSPKSLKSSIWGWLGNYTGFTGYYNPFTGESQVNTTVPKFLQPYIACHEVAHQLGYAKEMEANFVGYLAATATEDPLFQYSVYLDLFQYANRNLAFVDMTAAKKIRSDLSIPVRQDLKEWREFNNRHTNPIEPYIRNMYGFFLQQNQQPQGILSYDEVTGFLIAYYKKYNRL